mgnify:CR=1 FL=1
MSDRKEYLKKYYQKKKEDKEWVEQQKIACNEYKKRNKKSCKEKARLYKKTYEGKKSHKISEWKIKLKLKETLERLDYIFDRWYFSKNCEVCNIEYSDSIIKCMDHHHASGHFRCICCNRCNVKLGVLDNKIRSVLLELHRYHINI